MSQWSLRWTLTLLVVAMVKTLKKHDAISAFQGELMIDQLRARQMVLIVGTFKAKPLLITSIIHASFFASPTLDTLFTKLEELYSKVFYRNDADRGIVNTLQLRAFRVLNGRFGHRRRVTEDHTPTSSFSSRHLSIRFGNVLLLRHSSSSSSSCVWIDRIPSRVGRLFVSGTLRDHAATSKCRH